MGQGTVEDASEADEEARAAHNTGLPTREEDHGNKARDTKRKPDERRRLKGRRGEGGRWKEGEEAHYFRVTHPTDTHTDIPNEKPQLSPGNYTSNALSEDGKF